VYPIKIILHHSLTTDNKTVSMNAIRKYHMAKGWKNIGYHYLLELVNNRYEIFVGRMLNETGAHTKGQNGRSIGICLVGNFDLKPPPKEQWDLAINLVSALRQTFVISLDDIYGHCDFANKTCPGAAFDIDLFKSQIN